MIKFTLTYYIALSLLCGSVAQLVEHYLDMVGVAGSSPVATTIFQYDRIL